MLHDLFFNLLMIVSAFIFNEYHTLVISLTNSKYAQQARSIVNVVRINEDHKARIIRGML